MSFDEELEIFKRWVEQQERNPVFRESGGASNSPFVMENGFRLGLWNLERASFEVIADENRSFCFITRIGLPPNKALHVALVFRGENIRLLGERRDEIVADVGRGNLIRIYLHSGDVFLRQPSKKTGKDSDPNVIESTDPTFGRPIRPDAAYFADVRRSGRLDQVEISYVEFLSQLLSPLPFVRLEASPSLSGESLDPKEVPVTTVKKRIAALGGVYSDQLIYRYHVALNHLSHKHFVLLTGISGTGKTLLAKAYAYAILGEVDLRMFSEDFYLIPIRPDWSDPAHLIGFFDVVSGTYRRTRFLEAVLRANENRDRPVFICLDEMNLAQPEHYFADIMSSMESGEDIALHDQDPAKAGVPARIAWPRNLYITGTVNVDETTRPFSPKLLDRANVIDLSEVRIDEFVNTLARGNPDLREVLPEIRDTLERLRSELEPFALQFGYRSIEEIARFIAFASKHGVLNGEALDIQVEQKILTKLRGGIEHRTMLTKVLAVLEDLPRSKAVVERMVRDLEAYSSFQYWP